MFAGPKKVEKGNPGHVHNGLFLRVGSGIEQGLGVMEELDGEGGSGRKPTSSSVLL